MVCSHILAAVNKAAENVGAQVPLGDPGSSSFGQIQRGGIAGWLSLC